MDVICGMSSSEVACSIHGSEDDATEDAVRCGIGLVSTGEGVTGTSLVLRASSALRRYSDLGSTERLALSGVRDDSDADREVEGVLMAPRAGLREVGVDMSEEWNFERDYEVLKSIRK